MNELTRYYFEEQNPPSLQIKTGLSEEDRLEASIKRSIWVSVVLGTILGLGFGLWAKYEGPTDYTLSPEVRQEFNRRMERR